MTERTGSDARFSMALALLLPFVLLLKTLLIAGRRIPRYLGRGLLRLLPAFALMGAILAAPAVEAQIPTADNAETAPAAAPDPFGRDNPRAMADGLISALGAQDYARASQYFDLSRLSRSRRESQGQAYARQLQALLDSGGSITPFIVLSDNPSGRVDDDLPPDQERIGTLPGAEGQDDIPLIAVAKTEEGRTIWRISYKSLVGMPSPPAVAAGSNWRDKLPPFLSQTTLGGAPLADWLILILSAVVLYVLARLFFAGVLFLVGKWKTDRENSRLWRFVHAASSPLSLYIAVWLFLGASQKLGVAIVARQFLSRFAGTIALIALAWFLWRLVDVVTDLIAMRMDRTQRRRAKSAIVFVRRAAKLFLIAFAIIAGLDTFGVDVTTGIAALGLGGLALALGAQKTVENIVGSISVIADEPVRVGDFCKVGDVVGTVEDIGIRSTRIRTNDRTRVTIPNGNFASLQIENYAWRDRFLFNPTLGLTYDLDADGMERVVAEVRAALSEAEFIMEGARAAFSNFGASSLDIEIFAYIAATDFNESVYFREKLLLDIMRRVTKAGGSFAFPTTSVRVETLPERAFAHEREEERGGRAPTSDKAENGTENG